MITDKLSNINKYSCIPPYIRKYLANVKFIPGKHKINNTDFVNCEEYSTKPQEACCFEVHKKYADIQLIVSGKERLDYIDFEQLSLKMPYDKEKDIEFWTSTSNDVTSYYLDGTNFILLFPGEPHSPQMNFKNTSQKVKKIVVKFIPE